MKAVHEKDQKFLDLLLSISEDCNYESRVYSGRGMSGEICVGIILEEESEIALLAYNIGREDMDDIARVNIDRMRTDNMGKNIIVYFPSVKVRDEESEAA